VIVLIADPADREATGSEASKLAEFLAGPRVVHRHLRSKEEIDSQLRSERKSWE